MWDLPGPGFEPVSPALASRFLSTAPPGKSRRSFSFQENDLSFPPSHLQPLTHALSPTFPPVPKDGQPCPTAQHPLGDVPWQLSPPFPAPPWLSLLDQSHQHRSLLCYFPPSKLKTILGPQSPPATTLICQLPLGAEHLKETVNTHCLHLSFSPFKLLSTPPTKTILVKTQHRP